MADIRRPTTVDLINNLKFSGAATADLIAETDGFTTKGDGGGAQWKLNGVTGQTVSQTPAQLGDALLNDASGNQWSLVGDRINLLSVGLSESNTGAQNDLVIAAAIATASTVVNVILADKIDQVEGSIYLPSGRFDYTEVDIPDGIMIEGDNAATSILIDTGTSTARASIEVGDNIRESHRNGLTKVGLVGAGITDRNGVNFNKSFRLSGLFECDIDGFFDNVTGDTFAISFIHNRIYSAIRDNFSLINGTAITFDRNRIELAGRHNVFVDGQQANEPINLSFNNDKIQSAQESGILGIDCLGVEMNGVFIEANNQAGGADHVAFVGGTAAREKGVLNIRGGFMSPGTGMTDSAAVNAGNMKSVNFNGFIRGGFDEGLRIGSSVENAFIFGEIDGPAAQTVIPIGVNYIRALRGSGIELKGFTEQKTFKRIRSTGSNATSQDLDSTVFIDTTGGNRTYTVQTVDIVAGRQIKVQKISGDANQLIIATEGSELVNSGATFSTTAAHALLTLSTDGVNVFVG